MALNSCIYEVLEIRVVGSIALNGIGTNRSGFNTKDFKQDDSSKNKGMKILVDSFPISNKSNLASIATLYNSRKIFTFSLLI